MDRSGLFLVGVDNAQPRPRTQARRRLGVPALLVPALLVPALLMPALIGCGQASEDTESTADPQLGDAAVAAGEPHASLDAGSQDETATAPGLSPEHDLTSDVSATQDSTHPNTDPNAEGTDAEDTGTEDSDSSPLPGEDTSAVPGDTSGSATDTQDDSAPSSNEDDPETLCGDAIIGSSETCDDGNPSEKDGCSACRIEPGFACSGEPSVCVPTSCGNGVMEGAEGCDDGNADPFDGCSPLCVAEPDCSGSHCASRCGDGLVVDEACDDGNTVSGDGCSATCSVEDGFDCAQPACETVNGACVLKVYPLYRDFDAADPDFGFSLDGVPCGSADGAAAVLGIAATQLGQQGHPVAAALSADACIASTDSFASWFTGGKAWSGELTLFSDGDGTFVNRSGKNGEQFVVHESTSDEEPVPSATSQETCEPGCTIRVRVGLQCENTCRESHDVIRARQDALGMKEHELEQTQDQLTLAESSQASDPEVVAELTQQVADISAEIDTLKLQIEERQQAAATCDEECSTSFDSQVASCVADCHPCSFSGTQFCTGGSTVAYDGTPLFFPVDALAAAELSPATLQYGYENALGEAELFPDAQTHNFDFSLELRHWFRYREDEVLKLGFTSDDDLFVFINGHLALDLGGLHVPLDANLIIDAAHAEEWGLESGNVYPISIFKAERMLSSSALRLTLPAFDTRPSVCKLSR